MKKKKKAENINEIGTLRIQLKAKVMAFFILYHFKKQILQEHGRPPNKM